LARKRMENFRQAKSDQAREGVTLTDGPETSRGVRAQSANYRRRDNQDRQRSRRSPLGGAIAGGAGGGGGSAVAEFVQFAGSPSRRGT
jgi:hypothetical protein